MIDFRKEAIENARGLRRVLLVYSFVKPEYDFMAENVGELAKKKATILPKRKIILPEAYCEFIKARNVGDHSVDYLTRLYDKSGEVIVHLIGTGKHARSRDDNGEEGIAPVEKNWPLIVRHLHDIVLEHDNAGEWKIAGFHTDPRHPGYSVYRQLHQAS